MQGGFQQDGVAVCLVVPIECMFVGYLKMRLLRAFLIYCSACRIDV